VSFFCWNLIIGERVFFIPFFFQKVSAGQCVPAAPLISPPDLFIGKMMVFLPFNIASFPRNLVTKQFKIILVFFFKYFFILIIKKKTTSKKINNNFKISLLKVITS